MCRTVIVFLLVVVSIAGFMSCERADMYNIASEIPVESVVLIYSAGTYTGNLGGRIGADNICKTNLQAKNLVWKEFTRTKALISTGEFDSMRNVLPIDYWYLPVYGLTGSGGPALLADNWNSLWDGSIDATLAVAVGISTNWWNGSYSDGSYYDGGTCNGWTDDLAATGINGDYAVTTWAWIYFANSACTNTYNLLCIAF